jgi:phage terminase large subunit
MKLDFSKNLQISNFMKIRQVGAEMFYADGRTDRRTDMTKLIVGFRNFSNTPKTAREAEEREKGRMMKGKKGNGNK